MGENARRTGQFRATATDAQSKFSIRRRFQATTAGSFSLKQKPCPLCGCAESLNRHSKLYGNDPATRNGQSVRGQRVFCSNRGQRGGCGKTFSIFLAEVLPRHTVRAPLLWQLLGKLLAGLTVRSSVQALRLPFALETLYHLLERLRGRLSEVRSLLCREHQVPASCQSEPLLQTVEHLQGVFPNPESVRGCALSAFQLRFQRPLMG